VRTFLEVYKLALLDIHGGFEEVEYAAAQGAHWIGVGRRAIGSQFFCNSLHEDSCTGSDTNAGKTLSSTAPAMEPSQAIEKETGETV